MPLNSRIKVNVHLTYVSLILGRVMFRVLKETIITIFFFFAKHSIKILRKSSLKSNMYSKH